MLSGCAAGAMAAIFTGEFMLIAFVSFTQRYF